MALRHSNSAMIRKIGQAKILIVDQDSEVHSTLGKMLSSQGFDVECAYSANDARAMIKNNPPDISILDSMLERTNGMELCKEIKENEGTKDMLVLITSPDDEQGERLHGFATGADDYEVKPFHFQSLVRKIKFMLQKKRAANPVVNHTNKPNR